MTSEPRMGDILLVEDDPLLAATTRRGLDRLLLPVRLAESCAQAVAAWETVSPLAVLMDYRLPDGFGTDVIQRMRRQERDEPVFCMTAESESISDETCRALNIMRVLTKPVLPSVIAAAIEALPGRERRRPRGARTPRCIGRFRIIRVRGVLTQATILRLSRAAGKHDWLAIRLPAGPLFDDQTASVLCAWAAWLSAHGGRLCLLVEEATSRDGVARRVGDGIDVFGDPRQLASHGLRLTGRGERHRLLAHGELWDQAR